MNAVLKRILVKLGWTVVVFLGITVISFWVIHLAPGSPTDLQTTLNPQAGAEARARLEKLYGLDQPLHVQYFDWLKRLGTLDFGRSLSGDHRPVWDKIKERLPLTFGMNVASLVLTLMIAVPIGVTAAWRRGGWFDRISTVLVFIGFAMPGFWLALLLMLWLGIYWPVLPISGLTSLGFDTMPWHEQIIDLARHLAMPIFIYTFGSWAGMSRYMRSGMLEVLRQDYIMTARARGFPAAPCSSATHSETRSCRSSLSSACPCPASSAARLSSNPFSPCRASASSSMKASWPATIHSSWAASCSARC